MSYRLALSCIFLHACAATLLACDACNNSIGDPARGGGSGFTAGVGDMRRLISDLRDAKGAKDGTDPATTLSDGSIPDLTKPSPVDPKMRRWSLDTTFEYRRFQQNRAENAFLIVQAGHDQHAYRFDYFVNEHIGYLINEDLSVGVSAGFRDLHKVNVDDANRIGQRETSTGATGLSFDAKYRFIKQSECFPLDLAVFAAIKTPFGETNNRRTNGNLFETEDQPSSGSLDETLGLAASHGWEKWGASASASYTHKGVGSQEFKEGDLTRLSLSASRLLSPTACPWKLYGSAGLQGLLEREAVDHHVPSRDHGGRNMFFIPGLAAKPTDRLIVSLSAPIPVIQDENGTHQKQRWNLQLGVGVRF